MKEDICKTCGAELKWVGSIVDGHVECPNCDGAKVNYAGVSVEQASDDGVFYDDCGDLMCTPDPRTDKLNFKEQYQTEFVEDGRRTGKTYDMLCQAVECMSGCYVIVHNASMKDYCARMLIDKLECIWLSETRHIVLSPNRSHVVVMTVQEAIQRGVTPRRRQVLFDHMVSYEQRGGVNGHL